jgi:hypothetical protein
MAGGSIIIILTPSNSLFSGFKQFLIRIPEEKLTECSYFLSKMCKEVLHAHNLMVCFVSDTHAHL